MWTGEPIVEWFLSGAIDRRKFDEYLLSPSHPTGRHKARLWRSVFGAGEGDGELLARLIMEQLPQAERVEERNPVPGREGLTRRFTIDIPRFQGPNGNVAVVRTNWVLGSGEQKPRLSTAFPKPWATAKTDWHYNSGNHAQDDVQRAGSGPHTRVGP